jgi:CelD/BcsL family acetyltransferase involved in cellulose biosynthesis
MFFARQGWLRIYILYVDDLPCAFLIGQLYNRTFYCQHAGYQPAFAHFSVGSLLTAWALEDIGAAGVEQVDLGEGGQEHNRRLGCQMCEEGTVHLYSSTLRGFWLNLFFASAQIVRVGGRRTLSGLRLNRVSKIWRESLIAGWKHQNPLF